jgi:PAS domain S-box-containing protein
VTEPAFSAPAPHDRLLLIGAAATGACVVAGVTLSRFGPFEHAPSWTALGALALLSLALYAEHARRPVLVFVACVPVVVLAVIVLGSALVDAPVRSLIALPNNSAAGLLTVALASLLGTAERRSHLLMFGTVLAALALSLGAFGVFGRLAGIAPGIGWSSVSSVSLLTGAGLIISGATLLLQRARTRDDGEAVLRASLMPALFVLAVALGATAMAWRVSAEAATAARRQRFAHQVEQIAAAIEQRLRSYFDLLSGAQGLFAASENVDADEWRRYWEQTDLQTRYPGIAGIGFAPRIRARSRSDFEGDMAARLRPDFRIWPESANDTLYPVSYLEPARGPNLTLAGFDLGSDPVRRAALERALALDAFALGGKVEVAGRNTGETEPGFAVYVPLRPGRRDGDPDGVIGVAYLEFRAHEWMRSIGAESRDGLHMRIYDGESENAANLLYADGEAVAPSPLRHAQTLTLAGRPWHLVVTAAPAFVAASASAMPLSILLVGLFCSLLLFAIAWLLADLRARAERLAARRTRELERSQQAFRALTDTANDAIIAADSDGRIRYLNAAARRCFGYDAETLLLQPLTVLMPERYREQHLGGMARFLGGAEPRVIGSSVEVAGLRRDGSEFPLEISIGHWQSDGEHHFTAILRDITVRRDTETALATQRKELERSNADLEQFAYVASHDLQEPLRMVASYVQLLARRYKGKLGQDADDFIGFAVDGALRMQRLIDDLLAYSRIGTRSESPRDVSASECLQAALRNLAARIDETRADIRAGALPTVCVDPLQFTQLLQNLIGNALKFCSDERPLVRVDAVREDDHWHFRVSDNGIGIDPQYAERIFVIFQRLHTRQHYAGTGIGLAICKRIIEQIGGRIWVESRLGHGATFHFTVPATEQAP